MQGSKGAAKDLEGQKERGHPEQKEKVRV